MVKRPKTAYVVLEGRKPGVYDTWTDAEAQVKGYPGAKFKGLTEDEGGLYKAKEDLTEYVRMKTLAASTPPPQIARTPPPAALAPIAPPRTIINLISPEKAPPSRKSCKVHTRPQPKPGKQRQRPQSWDEPDVRARKGPWLDHGTEHNVAHSFDTPPEKNFHCPRALDGDATSGTESESTSSSDSDHVYPIDRKGMKEKRKTTSSIKRKNNACDSSNPTSQNDDDDNVRTESSTSPEVIHVERIGKRNPAAGEGKVRSSGGVTQDADFISLGATDDDDDEFNQRFLDPSKPNTAGGKLISHVLNTDASLVEKPVEPPLTAEQQALVDVILSGRNVFYTGSAGTGKSTVLKAFKGKLEKQGKAVDIIAPTGIAALQIGGVTSFVYAGWNVSSQQQSLEDLQNNATFQKRVHKRLCKTDVLVIDEISMVENHHFARLDAIMRASRSYQRQGGADSDSEGEGAKEGEPRNRFLPFGGVQIVVTGDFCQLPPVKPFSHCLGCGSETKESPGYLRKHYDCPKCETTFKDTEKWAFCSAAWQECDFHYAHLQTIHRQSDPKFVDILQRCRLGEVLTQADRHLLLNHPSDTQNATRLSSRKVDVQDINEQAFARLSGPIRTYPCLDDWNCLHDYLGDYFSTNSYSGPKIYVGHSLSDSLQLRKGMQVALLANLDPANGLVNGTTGQVLGFVPIDFNKTPEFKGKDAAHQTENFRRFLEKVKAEGVKEWPLIKFNTEAPGGITRMVKSVCRTSSHGYPPPSSWASRTQLPLMPAWAMTIHKSQGMTLSKVEIDLARTFESGQDYVALSRARGLMGLKVTGLRRDMKGGNRQVMEFLWKKFGVGRPPEGDEEQET